MRYLGIAPINPQVVLAARSLKHPVILIASVNQVGWEAPGYSTYDSFSLRDAAGDLWIERDHLGRNGYPHFEQCLRTDKLAKWDGVMPDTPNQKLFDMACDSGLVVQGGCGEYEWAGHSIVGANNNAVKWVSGPIGLVVGDMFSSGEIASEVLQDLRATGKMVRAHNCDYYGKPAFSCHGFNVSPQVGAVWVSCILQASVILG